MKTMSFMRVVPAVLSLLVVSACADWEQHMQSKLPPAVPYYQDKEIKVTATRSVHQVSFADASAATLSAFEVSKLADFLNEVDPERRSVVMVEQVSRKQGASAHRQGAAVADALTELGYRTEAYADAYSADGVISVAVDHVVAYAPNCPNWEINEYESFGAGTLPNHGCASQVNLAAMIDNPADLVAADVAPRPSGHTTTYGEIRIRRDEVRQLEDAEASFSTSE